jgi:hypothetical protein
MSGTDGLGASTVAAVRTGTLQKVKQRSVDPYRDLDVIDARGPRVMQATIGVLALVAFGTGWWPLIALLAGQLALGLTLGRRWCVPCVFYFEVLQPRFGEGPIEDARPPRFANLMGMVVLGSAALFHALGLHALGWTLALLVAALALLSATTGFCLGCQIYRLVARVRGIEVCETCTPSKAALSRQEG